MIVFGWIADAQSVLRHKLLRTAAAASVAAATALAGVVEASASSRFAPVPSGVEIGTQIIKVQQNHRAGPRRGHPRRAYPRRGYPRHGYPRYYPRYRYNGGYAGAAAAAGIIGLATGAIIAGSVSRPYYGQYPYYGYYPRDRSRVYYNAPPRGTYRGPARGRYEPWTPAWYESCRRRFRSFDPASGTYLGYDGRRHFCN